MTDKLPIERLEELLDIAQAEKESFELLVSGAILDGHRLEAVWENDFQQWRDHAKALRELIALRKTQPENEYTSYRYWHVNTFDDAPPEIPPEKRRWQDPVWVAWEARAKLAKP